jgi:DNA (cytosine-5)-methyltransferase 1
MTKDQPIALDLFSGGGGAGMGYRRSGFRLIGIDKDDHAASYASVGEFHQMDWREGLRRFGPQAALIHASPPCQRYSSLTRWGAVHAVAGHPDLLMPTWQALRALGKPFVIENVNMARFRYSIQLCAWSFGYEMYRHRRFAVSDGQRAYAIGKYPHRRHETKSAPPGHWVEGQFFSVAGHFGHLEHAQKIMDIDWMSREEMAEAIPPYYTAWIGKRLQETLFKAWASSDSPPKTA